MFVHPPNPTHAYLTVFCVGGTAQGNQTRLPIRPFFDPDLKAQGFDIDNMAGSRWCRWEGDYPNQQTFSLVSPNESKFQTPGHPHTPRNPMTVLSLDGQAQYGEAFVHIHQLGQCVWRLSALISVETRGTWYAN